MPTVKQILRGIAAIIVGYAMIVLFAIIFQDWLFGGLSFSESPTHHLLIGGTLTAVGAVIGAHRRRDLPLPVRDHHRPVVV